MGKGKKQGKSKGTRTYPKSDGSKAVMVDGQFAGSVPGGKAKGLGNEENLILSSDEVIVMGDMELGGSDSVREAWREYALVPRAAFTPESIQGLIEDDGSTDSAKVSRSLSASFQNLFAEPTHAQMMEIIDGVRKSSESRKEVYLYGSVQYKEALESAEGLVESLNNAFSSGAVDSDNFFANIGIDDSLDAYNYGVQTVVVHMVEKLPGLEGSIVSGVIRPRLHVMDPSWKKIDGVLTLDDESRESEPQSPLIDPITYPVDKSDSEYRRDMFLRGMRDTIVELDYLRIGSAQNKYVR